MIISAQPRDIENVTVAGGISGIIDVYNYTVASGQWYQIPISSETKQILLQPRDRIDWQIATISGGAYFTARAGAAIKGPIVTTSGNTLCWVKPLGSTVFELLVGA